MFQRYVNKVNSEIAQKKDELFELERNEQEIQRKLLQVKSNPNDGNLCRACHMRLGHDARHCKYEKCASVYHCGEEKFHPGEIGNRGLRCSIKRLKGDISKLEKDLSLKQKAS